MRSRFLLPAVLISVGCAFGWPAENAQDKTIQPKVTPSVDRTVLPPAAPEFKGKIGTNYSAAREAGDRT